MSALAYHRPAANAGRRARGTAACTLRLRTGLGMAAVRVCEAMHDYAVHRVDQESVYGWLRTAVRPHMAGLVEAWVGGSDWDQVTKDCSLDPGDVARLLSRTADLLRQVSRIGVLVICSLRWDPGHELGSASPLLVLQASSLTHIWSSLVMRVLKLCSRPLQVMHCEDLLPDMRASARKAVRAMQRAPIADLVQ